MPEGTEHFHEVERGGARFGSGPGHAGTGPTTLWITSWGLRRRWIEPLLFSILGVNKAKCSEEWAPRVIQIVFPAQAEWLDARRLEICLYGGAYNLAYKQTGRENRLGGYE